MKQIGNQFKQMGNAIILNLLFALIIWFIIYRNHNDFKFINDITEIGAVGELIFVIWSIRWWYITGDKFLSLNITPDKKEQEQPIGDNSLNQTKSVFSIFIAILLLCLLIFLFGI